MPKAHVLLIDDDPSLLKLMDMRLTAAGYRTTALASAEDALRALAREVPDVLVTDVRLPGMDGLTLFDEIRHTHASLPVIMLTAHGTIEDAIQAISRGALAYLTKPFDGTVLLEKVDQALALVGGLHLRAPTAAWCQDMLYKSQSVAKVLAEARLMAASDASILIQGASGTGKELLARAVHRASRRAMAPFVAVNCAAIPEALLESELFGHVKGAFTGAQTARRGLMQSAQGGTLFLDEIGDMPLTLQVKLLRVLQEGQVRPLGADHDQGVDVRVLSATHQDLEAAQRDGRFRTDLFYRLNVLSLTLPPLADRREDIPLLANHFRQKLARQYGKPIDGFAPDALAALVAAPWPGNVRQLHNVVEQVCALTPARLIALPLVLRALRGSIEATPSYDEAKTRFERDYLSDLMQRVQGNVSDAARLAGRNRTEFYRLLNKHHLRPQGFRPDADPVAPNGRHN